jgi:hypothetical protein
VEPTSRSQLLPERHRHNPSAGAPWRDHREFQTRQLTIPCHLTSLRNRIRSQVCILICGADRTLSLAVVVIVVTPPNDKDFFARSASSFSSDSSWRGDKVVQGNSITSTPKIPNPVEELVVGVLSIAFVVPNEKLTGDQSKT